MNQEQEKIAAKIAKWKARPPMTKPDPLGIEPRFIWVERRRDALLAAMKRYEAGNRQVPAELISELAEHMRWLEEIR